MTRLNKAALALATAGVLVSGVAQAALFDRGGGLIYDDVLKITWLSDANYAKTNNYDSDGRMNWTCTLYTSSMPMPREPSTSNRTQATRAR